MVPADQQMFDLNFDASSMFAVKRPFEEQTLYSDVIVSPFVLVYGCTPVGGNIYTVRLRKYCQ